MKQVCGGGSSKLFSRALEEAMLSASAGWISTTFIPPWWLVRLMKSPIARTWLILISELAFFSRLSESMCSEASSAPVTLARLAGSIRRKSGWAPCSAQLHAVHRPHATSPEGRRSQSSAFPSASANASLPIPCSPRTNSACGRRSARVSSDFSSLRCQGYSILTIRYHYFLKYFINFGNARIGVYDSDAPGLRPRPLEVGRPYAPVVGVLLP